MVIVAPPSSGPQPNEVVPAGSPISPGPSTHLVHSWYSAGPPSRIRICDGANGGEVSPAQMWEVFEAEYLSATTPVALNSHHTSSVADADDELDVNVYLDGAKKELRGIGNGPIAAFVDALRSVGHDVRVLDYAEHALSSGGDARAAAYVECAIGERILWGVGIDANIVTASLKAVVSAVNRAAAG
jgi:2-isopropylmalate synthase